MTPQEAADMRTLEQRVGKLEAKLFYARRGQLYAERRARKSENEARFLHGILLLNEVEIPERMEAA